MTTTPPVVNGWLKFKAERDKLQNKEAARAAAAESRRQQREAQKARQKVEADLQRASKLAERKAAQQVALEARLLARSIEKAKKREARELERLEYLQQHPRPPKKKRKSRLKFIEPEAAPIVPFPVSKPEVPRELIVLAAEGHLPGFVSTVPHIPEKEVKYADQIKDRYVLHLPDDDENYYQES